MQNIMKTGYKKDFHFETVQLHLRSLYLYYELLYQNSGCLNKSFCRICLETKKSAKMKVAAILKRFFGIC